VKPYYSDGSCVLYAGDYRDCIESVGDHSVDLVLSDPPYGTTALDWDKKVELSVLWTQIERVCKELALVVSFAAQPFTTDLINSKRDWFRYELIWEKTNPVGWLDCNRRPLRSHENVVVFSKKWKGTTYNPQLVPGAVYTSKHRGVRVGIYGFHKDSPVEERSTRHPGSVHKYGKGDKRGQHPTQKPIGFVEWMVRSYSNPGDLILDTFAGGGTTLVAAKANGRRAIGFETREEYCEMTAKRLMAMNLN
jgi:site-specific DNA-methyltransferase (adenine-specific)